ncbi:AMP-binding protein [Sulfitobacter sp.]|uniref:AMP-binding protein n=1 Tax=Sulfitobacter sp. TaxID=1903071 RepID=UPI003EF4BC00
MLSRFQRHPDARAFAGREEVLRTDGPATAHIPAHPLAKAFDGLDKALGNRSPFCVSDTLPPNLGTLAPDHFATLTGGTSGTPKVILRTQKSWISSFETNAAHFAYTSKDSIAVLGALSHSLALYGVLEGLHLGLTVHALSPLKPTSQSDTLHSARCTVLYATPTQLRLLPTGKTLSHVRLILCGGGTLSGATRTHITSLCPNAAIHVFYGAAETSFITLSDDQTPTGSVGRPYPHVEISVRDPDDTGAGTLWVRSPYLFESYLHGDSSHTQREGDWLTLGEVGRLDNEGYLHLRGRAGRVFNISDKTVYPEEIEAHLMSLEGIIQCAVLARPDPMRGHHLIVAVEGTENTDRRAALLNHFKEHHMALPREVVFLAPFPILPSGKPDLVRIAALTGSTV